MKIKLTNIKKFLVLMIMRTKKRLRVHLKENNKHMMFMLVFVNAKEKWERVNCPEYGKDLERESLDVH